MENERCLWDIWGMEKEENPFEDAVVAEEWIKSVENESGQVRDREIYPRLNEWVEEIKPNILVEIGSGQGICSEKISNNYKKYIGIEPSLTLTNRAREIYSRENREFKLGNAYGVPLPEGVADAVFFVNVWFHLADLDKTSSELFRILKPNSHFLIITANPSTYNVWESFYFDYKKDGNKIDGKVRVPINDLSRNLFYTHSLSDMKNSLINNGLVINKIEEFGISSNSNGHKELFISIEGYKK